MLLLSRADVIPSPPIPYHSAHDRKSTATCYFRTRSRGGRSAPMPGAKSTIPELCLRVGERVSVSL